MSTSASAAPRVLPAPYRERLMRVAREAAFPLGTRLFEEGGRADRFRIVRTGTVDLDMRVPGRGAAVIETLGHNALVGWSWLITPHVRRMGAEATSPVRAYEVDVAAVRAMGEADPVLGAAVAGWAGHVLAHRLQSARTRLLDLYAPYGGGRPDHG